MFLLILLRQNNIKMKHLCFSRSIITDLTIKFRGSNSLKVLKPTIAPFRQMSSTTTTDAGAVWSPPAKIEELYSHTDGNQFSAINAPTSGARVQKDVPPGTAPFQLYSLATPNGNLMFR
jgi:hypothetical protein